ncbi:MAG: hypothetical protein WBF77_01205 [Sulfurimonadaceae bacterium]
MIKLIMKSSLILFFLLGFSLGCSSDRESAPKEEKTGGGMKCGAGKCGANMFDGNAALVKKKANITAQMREDDPRRDSVFKAATTKEVYDCVRDPKTGKLTKIWRGDVKTGTAPMKCGAGKCGAAMQTPEPKKEPAMKCGAGKCGAM